MIDLLFILTAIVTVGLSTIIVLLLFQTPENVIIKDMLGFIFVISLVLLIIGVFVGLSLANVAQNI
jgi:hypothetical protein